MATVEITLFWLMLFAYVLAFCVHLFSFVMAKAAGIAYALRILWLAFFLHTAVVIVRWVAAGHAPVTTPYELNLTGMWFTVLIFLVLQKLGRIDAAVGLVVIPIVFLVLGQGLVLRQDATAMGAPFKSPWLAVHVIFAWLAFGCYAVATGAAVLLLLKEKFPGRPALTRVPGLEDLDLAGYRFIVLGFINHAVMLISGAIWAKKLWGYYWTWDALEIWSLIAFLFYAFYLHARSFLGWKTKRAAWLAVLGLIIVAISFWGVDWFAPSVHPGPLRVE